MFDAQLDFYETMVVPPYCGRGRPRTAIAEAKRQGAAAAKARRAAKALIPDSAIEREFRKKETKRHAAYYAKNTEKCKATARRSYRKYYEVRAATSKEQYRRKLEIGMLYRAERRAAKKGWAFNLTIADIVIPTHCPVLGIPLNVGAGEGRKAGCTDDSPTLDRIDNSRGYVAGNVCVISWRANRIKGDASLAEMEKLLGYMRSFA